MKKLYLLYVGLISSPSSSSFLYCYRFVLGVKVTLSLFFFFYALIIHFTFTDYHDLCLLETRKTR